MKEWYFQAMGQELGPFTASELKMKVEGGQIQAGTMVRRGLEGKWLYADRVKGLLPTRPAAPPQPAASAKPKSSATMPVLDGKPSSRPVPPSSHQIPIVSISLADDDQDTAQAPSAEFYDFVGFREAISPALHQAIRQYMTDHRLTMTQLNRRALANFIARPELAGDLMITNIAAIPQAVNAKSNPDGSHPLNEREQNELATFRITLFNCSNSSLIVTQGEFVPEKIDSRDYQETGTQRIPALNHQGHLTACIDGAKPGQAIPIKIETSVGPLEATNVVVWFQGTNKPSFTKIRGQFRFEADGEVALGETMSVIIHGDSP